ncbi:MAG: hypothetical protein IPM35_33995 [Myxococcales bacterium]|nr:hypothetical protein [Myxococcales bacterium]
MCARYPHRILLLIALALAALTAGCPGELEDPDRFGEPDATPSGGGSTAGDAGGDE